MKGSNPMLSGYKRKTRRGNYKQKSNDKSMQNGDSDENSPSEILDSRLAKKQNQNKRK